MSLEPAKSRTNDLSYMVGDENQGPKLDKGNKPAPSSAKVPLGNFEKMITTILEKSPERLLEDGEFSKTVKKCTQEIIHALHKTSEQVAKIAKMILLPLKMAGAFIDQVKKSFMTMHAPDSLNERVEPAEVPTNIVGMMASFLPEREAKAVLDPLLDQFAKKSERVAAKLAASKEAVKGEKWAKEVSVQIQEALKTQGENFVFPEELKRQTKEVTSLDLSNLEFPLSVKAMKEILANWPNITDLNLAGNRMTQEIVDLLQEFKDLRYLNLAATGMDDKMLAAVAKCTTLQGLHCSGCQAITSLEPLKSCLLLQTLYCGYSPRITSLEPLKSCPLLQTLHCSSCKITSLEPLKSCPRLQDLYFRNCPGITSLEPLKSCPSLQNLDCSRCPGITSLEPLKSCLSLHSLYCSECEGITSLEPLKFCPSLHSLYCSDCPGITSLEPLKSCPVLDTLGCSHCPGITSLEPLKSCPSLQMLYYEISVEQRAALKHILPALLIFDKNDAVS